MGVGVGVENAADVISHAVQAWPESGRSDEFFIMTNVKSTTSPTQTKIYDMSPCDQTNAVESKFHAAG